jgi:hypothetical protein
MKFYKIYLSSRVDIEIDDDDYQKLTQSISSGNLIKLKQAIINPSFIVCIIPFHKKPERVTTGFVDEKTRSFKVVEDKSVIVIPDAFKHEIKQLAEKMTIMETNLQDS